MISFLTFHPYSLRNVVSEKITNPKDKKTELFKKTFTYFYKLLLIMHLKQKLKVSFYMMMYHKLPVNDYYIFCIYVLQCFASLFRLYFIMYV